MHVIYDRKMLELASQLAQKANSGLQKLELPFDSISNRGLRLIADALKTGCCPNLQVLKFRSLLERVPKV